MFLIRSAGILALQLNPLTYLDLYQIKLKLEPTSNRRVAEKLSGDVIEGANGES